MVQYFLQYLAKMVQYFRLFFGAGGRSFRRKEKERKERGRKFKFGPLLA